MRNKNEVPNFNKARQVLAAFFVQKEFKQTKLNKYQVMTSSSSPTNALADPLQEFKLICPSLLFLHFGSEVKDIYNSFSKWKQEDVFPAFRDMMFKDLNLDKQDRVKTAELVRLLLGLKIINQISLRIFDLP